MADALVYPPLSAVDTTAKYTVGSIVEDGNGNEYIYLLGVAGVALGSCVSYNPATFATTIGSGASAGRLAFAMAAILATQYGWFCIKGNAPCVTAGTTVAAAAAFLAAAGAIDDAVVATDRIENAYFTTTTTPAGTVSIIYPQALGLG